jgi:hypothetical protein
MAAHAKKTGIATLLARCKMGEIEEQVAKKGLPAIFDSGSDKCCTDGEVDGFTCRWEIDLIQMPESMFAMPGDENNPNGTNANGTNANGTGTTPGGTPPVPGALGAALGATGAAPGMPPSAATNRPPGSPTDSIPNSVLTDPSKMMSGSADMGGMASAAMQYIYPMLKPVFEGQIRRATVTVAWKEGGADHSFDVTQYLVAEQPVLPGQQDAVDGMINGQPPGSTGAGTGTGTSTTGSGTGQPNQQPQLPFGLGQQPGARP